MRTKEPAADTSESTDSSAEYSLQIQQVGRVLHAVADGLASLLAQIVVIQAAISPRSTEPPMTTYTGTQTRTGLSASPMRTQRQHGSNPAPAFLTVGASSHHLTPTTLLLTCPTDPWRLEQAPLHRGILMRTKGPAADTSASTDSSADYSLQTLQVGRVLHAVADRLACLLAQIVVIQAAHAHKRTESSGAPRRQLNKLRALYSHRLREGCKV